MLPRIWLVWESQRFGEAGLTSLTCRWVMCTHFVQRGEVLGLVAQGSHQVMSTFGNGGVITGGIGNGWYFNWSISGIHVFKVGLCHELWLCKAVAMVLRLIALSCHWVMSTPWIEDLITSSLIEVGTVLGSSVGSIDTSLLCFIFWGWNHTL